MRMYKVDEKDIKAVKAGMPMSDPRHALVQDATSKIYDSIGHLSDAQLADYRERGLSDTELVEIIAVIGWYVLSTFTNNLANTEVDPFWTS